MVNDEPTNDAIVKELYACSQYLNTSICLRFIQPIQLFMSRKNHKNKKARGNFY